MKRISALGFTALPPSIRGAGWLLLSGLLFTLGAAAVRYLSRDIHFVEIAFFRSIFGVACMLPWLWRAGLGVMRTRHSSLYLLRGVNSVIAMLFWFGALAVMPIADATAISFATPLFISLAAMVYLKEPLRANRTVGLVVGFIGAMIIIRPGFAALNMGALAVLGAALFIAWSAIIVKIVVRDDTPDTIAFYQVLYMLLLTSVPAMFVWSWPGPEQWLWAAAVGVAMTLAQRAYTRAYAIADATAVMPFDFARLIFAAAFGFALFAELPDVWSVSGGAVIFAASLYAARGEKAGREKGE